MGDQALEDMICPLSLFHLLPTKKTALHCCFHMCTPQQNMQTYILLPTVKLRQGQTREVGRQKNGRQLTQACNILLA